MWKTLVLGIRGTRFEYMCDDFNIDWQSRPHAGRIDALVSLQRRIAGLHAAQLQLLALLASDPPTVSLPGHDDRSWVVDDVACALRMSAGVARARLAEAIELRRLPGAIESLGHGLISLEHARVLAEATMPLPDEAATEVSSHVLTRAADQSVAAFRRSVRRRVLAVDPRTAETRRSANVAERRVCMRPAGEGVAEFWALLPVDGAMALLSAVDALADRRVGDDIRTADQRRADALVQIGLDALAGDGSTVLPKRHRMRPAVQVTVALSTLLGIDDQPAELAGVGAIPAELARRLAADPSGTWRRLVTDAVGRLVDYGRMTYRPPVAVADHVIARDRRCRFPQCGRRAERGDIDHSRPWSRGGTTDAANLLSLCRRHHRLRHDTSWRYTRDASADVVAWSSPSGHLYTDANDPYPIDGTPPPPARRRVTRDDPDPPPF